MSAKTPTLSAADIHEYVSHRAQGQHSMRVMNKVVSLVTMAGSLGMGTALAQENRPNLAPGVADRTAAEAAYRTGRSQDDIAAENRYLSGRQATPTLDPNANARAEAKYFQDGQGTQADAAAEQNYRNDGRPRFVDP